MIEASEHITSTITAMTDFVTEFVGGLSWELAPESTPNPFIVYSIVQDPGLTKDLLGSFTVNLFVYDITLTSSAQKSELIKNHIADGGYKWKFIQSRSGYTATDAKEGFIELIYTFKL